MVKKTEKLHLLLNSWLIEHSPDIRSKLIASGNLMKVLKHVFWSQDKELMLSAKSWAEDKIWEVASSDWSNDRKEWAIKQFVCLFPYFLRLEDQQVKLPVLSSDRWVQETFSVEHIPLMPKYFPSSDQFYAYGLKPENPNYKSMLLYKGTTYPADSGYWTTLMADLFPFADIGTPIMWFGRKRVSAWAEQQTKGIDVMGKSLGGALSLMSHDIKNVETVTAVNPALPSSSKQISSGTKRTIILNREDSVSKVGVIPDDVIVKQAEIQGADKLPNGMAHTQPWLMNQKTTLIELNDAQKSDRRYKTWGLLYWLVRPVTFFVLLPFYLLHLLVAYIIDAIAFLFKSVASLFKGSPLILPSGPGGGNNAPSYNLNSDASVVYNNSKPTGCDIRPLIV